ncbi:MAG: FtsX-like permease family protein [Gallionella sp.]|nr:FtsX-like permease family protein [Gallionella sp.]
MNLFFLSLNLLRRDWRAGEWRVLLLALVLAVGSLSTVGLFADRVRQALQQQAQSLLGADLRIASSRPLPPAYRAAAKERGLQTTQSLNFLSMAQHGEQAVLSEIQAVESGYPLRGKIVISDGSEHAAQGSPRSGTVWVSGRMLRRLELSVGDEVGIGKQRFRVAAQIVRDLDHAVSFASFAPRVVMNADDLAATGLLQEGSRISYRLMVAGEAKQVEALREELKAKLSGNEKLEDVRDARPEIRTALERAEHFFGLAALTAAILAGVAMALAARRFVLRHLDTCAMLRCLGAQQDQVLRLFLYQFLLLGVVAALLGCALGYVTQAALVAFIESMRDAELPPPSVLPALKAAASGFALLLGFAFLPLLQLRSVPPLRVLRRELGAPQASTGAAYGAALLVLAGLFLWQAGSVNLGLAMLGGLLVGLLVFFGSAWLLLRSMERHAMRLSAHWRHAFANLARHGRANAMQIVALGLGGMALLLLTLVRADLLQSWQGKLPPDTPNRFVVNIQPDQRQPLLDFFARVSVPQPKLLPMVRGRLVAINARPVNGDSYAEPRTRELVEREFNLSYAEKMPEWNELLQGQWWPSASGREGFAQLSVEDGIATKLDIHLGDELTYNVGGTPFTARVTSLRKVQWDSMQVNFFVITTPELLNDSPVSYITSFYLPSEKIRAGDQLAREFPNLLLIDTGEMIAQVRGIIEQVSQTISIVFLFTLLSGIAVLYAAMLAAQDERVHEAAILRTLGADSAYLRSLHLSEFAVLGLLSGLLAAGGAVLLGWVLAHFVLEIPYRASLIIWPVGALGGMLLVMLAGWLGTRRLTVLPPLAILRE